MLEEGRSYSGYERNSAFLNLRSGADQSPRFADVSGASGLDVLDDGRSIGITDWDHDGMLDFWITNRTGPRLRLQHNRSRTENRFIALKLTGREGNRGAVGARVQLTVDGKRVRARSIRAGEGFLAQSSTWLHFGLREGEKVTRAEVRWPDSSSMWFEEFEGLTAGQFYTLNQGDRVAQPWTPPPPDRLPEARPVPRASERARIVLASRLPFPGSSYQPLGHGAGKSVAAKRFETATPLLINLWATWCAPCVAEHQQWASEWKALEQSDLTVLALSVDEPDLPVEARQKVLNTFLKKHPLPFELGLATPAFLEMLEALGRAQLDKFEAFPIPSSLLLDARGRLAVIYKGPVSVNQLTADVDLLNAEPHRLRQEAAHFPGIWIEGPWPATPTVMIDKLMSFGRPEGARAYLDVFAESSDPRYRQGLSESYFLVANELRLQGSDEAAIRAYARAVSLDPKKTRARLELGTMLFKARRFVEAVPHLAAAVRGQPDDRNGHKMWALSLLQAKRFREAVPQFEALVASDAKDGMAHLWLGHALVRVRRPLDAVTHYRASRRLQPESFLAANELAWLLVTHTQADVRNVTEGLALAQTAATQTQQRNPEVLDTLAAAQAATGDYTAAVGTVTRALKLADEARNTRLKAALERRLKIYQQRRPYREALPPPE